MSTKALVKVDDNPPGSLTLGAANGMPGPLDGSGKLPTSQVPGVAGSDPSALHQSNNLSDVASPATALANLGGAAQVPTVGSYTYDGSGRVTADPDGNTYTYNSDDTVATITKGGVTRTATYGANGIASWA